MPTTTKTAYLPCPFCGGTDLFLPIVSTRRQIECAKCGAEGPITDHAGTEVATARWNDRVEPAARTVIDNLKRQALTDLTLAETRAALLTILDAVDYTADACRLMDPVGTVLDVRLIDNARKVLGLKAPANSSHQPEIAPMVPAEPTLGLREHVAFINALADGQQPKNGGGA